MSGEPASARIPARLNVVIAQGQVVVALLLLAIVSHAPLPVAVAAAVAFSFVMQTGFAVIHEAEHDKLHPDPARNLALGRLAATMFPGSFAFMRAAHLAHHRNNRADVELVDYVLPGQSRVGKALQYYFLVTGGVWLGVPALSLLLALLPDSAVERPGGRLPAGAVSYLRSIATARPSTVRRELLGVVIFWGIVAWLFDLHLLPTLAAYALFAFSWSSQQYIYHVRTPRHLVEGAWNLRLWRPVELLYLRFNHHLAHHRDVSAPWTLTGADDPPPTRGYLATYLALWAPPEPVEAAWPREHQARGPLPER